MKNTSAPRKSEELISMFLARADEFGCAGLTVKQMRWLLDVLGRENRGLRPSRTYNVRSAEGQFYTLAVYPNGAGFLKPR